MLCHLRSQCTRSPQLHRGRGLASCRAQMSCAGARPYITVEPAMCQHGAGWERSRPEGMCSTERTSIERVAGSSGVLGSVHAGGMRGGWELAWIWAREGCANCEEQCPDVLSTG